MSARSRIAAGRWRRRSNARSPHGLGHAVVRRQPRREIGDGLHRRPDDGRSDAAGSRGHGELQPDVDTRTPVVRHHSAARARSTGSTTTSSGCRATYLSGNHATHELVGQQLRNYWRRYNGALRVRASVSRDFRDMFTFEVSGRQPPQLPARRARQHHDRPWPDDHDGRSGEILRRGLGSLISGFRDQPGTWNLEPGTWDLGPGT